MPRGGKRGARASSTEDTHPSKASKPTPATPAQQLTRRPGDPVTFPDHPEFRPNVTPQEMFEMGVFGGSYFRPIYSSVKKEDLSGQHEEFRAAGWWDNVPDNKLCNVRFRSSANKFGVKAGLGLEYWESHGWIAAQDPYGWVQWYCRFYSGRRSVDDMRQIDRWNRYTGPKTGRWKRNLVNKLKRAGASYDDVTISPVVRQGLLQWGYVLVPDDLK